MFKSQHFAHKVFINKQLQEWILFILIYKSHSVLSFRSLLHLFPEYVIPSTDKRSVQQSNSTALTKNALEMWTAPICQTVWYTAQEMGRFFFCAAASAFYLLRPLRVPTVPFRLIPPLRKGVFARRICGQAFPGMAVRFAEKSYSAREKAPEDCFGHLFRCFLPILQCFLQKRLYKWISKTYYIIIGSTSLRK